MVIADDNDQAEMAEVLEVSFERGVLGGREADWPVLGELVQGTAGLRPADPRWAKADVPEYPCLPVLAGDTESFGDAPIAVTRGAQWERSTTAVFGREPLTII